MKPLFIISCPIDTYSGYGARSRDIVRALIELDNHNIQILPQKWGNTPWGFIEDHPEWAFLNDYLLPPGNQLPSKPKIWAQVTVPNEFQPMGEFNIGFTAGIETTLCSPHWIDGMNRMDLNFVSSKHAKDVFKSSRFTKEDNNGNKLGEIFNQKPIEVLFEGADLAKYFPSKEKNNIDLSQIKENFAFLGMGHWMQGDLGEDRKNIGLLINLFYETFKNQKNPPALILKTSASGCSYLDRDQILNKIHAIKESIKASTLPNIYLLHGELSDKEINDLYNHKKVKALVSLTKGEGFGRPLLEFSLTKKPIITTNWSGHTDFLDSKFTTLVKGEVKPVHSSAVVENMILAESEWFSPDMSEVAYHLEHMFKNYKSYEKGTMLQYHKSKNTFSFNAMKETLNNFLQSYTPAFPEEIKLQLPKLQLPKLKKSQNVSG
jgi:hypothetical protein